MKPGIYLEEALKDVLRTSNFVHGMFNLITAPCGSGKTTVANYLAKELGKVNLLKPRLISDFIRNIRKVCRIKLGKLTFLIKFIKFCNAFGKESKGLPEELLHDNKERCVRIPMLSELRSLNLSNAVAIAVYEILRQDSFDGLQNEGKPTRYDW